MPSMDEIGGTRTMMSNEPTVRQYRSVDGQRVLSIVASTTTGHSRFIEEAHTQFLPGPVPEYWLWVEKERSGLYVSVESAEAAARAVIPWLAEVSD